MARLKGAKRQNNQLQLAFEEATTSEARNQLLWKGPKHRWRSAVQKACI